METWQIIGYACIVLLVAVNRLAKPKNSQILRTLIGLIFIVTTISLFLTPKEEPTESIQIDSSDEISPPLVRSIDSLMIYHDGLSTTYNQELRRLYELGQEEERRALEIVEAAAQGEELAESQAKQAMVTAIDYYRKGLTADPGSAEQCALHNLLGLAHYRISQLDEAKQAWEKSAELAQKMISAETDADEGQLALAIASGNLGVIYRDRNDLKKAIKMYSNALEIYEVLDHKDGMAASYVWLGFIHQFSDKLDKAEEMHLKALEIYEALGQKERIASQYSNLGFTYALLKNLGKSEEMNLKALDIYEAMDNKEQLAHQYRHLGFSYFASSELDKSEEMNLKALEMFEGLDNKGELASQYANLGTLYLIKPDLKKAEEYYRKALPLFEVLDMEYEIEMTKEALQQIEAELQE